MVEYLRNRRQLSKDAATFCVAEADHMITAINQGVRVLRGPRIGAGGIDGEVQGPWPKPENSLAMSRLVWRLRFVFCMEVLRKGMRLEWIRIFRV